MHPVCAVEICFNHASPQIICLISWPSGSQHRSKKLYFHADWRTFLCGRQILPEDRQKWTFLHHQQLIRSCHRFNNTMITAEKQGCRQTLITPTPHTTNGWFAVVRAVPVCSWISLNHEDITSKIICLHWLDWKDNLYCVDSNAGVFYKDRFKLLTIICHRWQFTVLLHNCSIYQACLQTEQSLTRFNFWKTNSSPLRL